MVIHHAELLCIPLCTKVYGIPDLLHNPGMFCRPLLQRPQLVQQSFSLLRRSLQVTAMAQKRPKVFSQLNEFSEAKKSVSSQKP